MRIERTKVWRHPFRDEIIDMFRSGYTLKEVDEFLVTKNMRVPESTLKRFKRILKKEGPMTYIDYKLGEIRSAFKAVEKHLSSIREVEKTITKYKKLSDSAEAEGKLLEMSKWDTKIEKLMYLYNRMVMDHVKIQDVIRSMATNKETENPDTAIEKARKEMMKFKKRIQAGKFSPSSIKIEEEENESD